MKILVFDNYDSFTYNLVHLIEKITGTEVAVFRNDEMNLDDVNNYDKIILSPGPGIPEEAGLMLPLIHRYAASKSILGVCLGHQAIGQAFGAQLINLAQVYHGVATPITIFPKEKNRDNTTTLYETLPGRIDVGRYHSWVVSKENLPDTLLITAEDDSGLIMGLRHTQYDVEGVQFHPESILTPDGETIMRNFLKK